MRGPQQKSPTILHLYPTSPEKAGTDLGFDIEWDEPRLGWIVRDPRVAGTVLCLHSYDGHTAKEPSGGRGKK